MPLIPTPSSQTWTLRLKFHRTTILLHSTPLTPFPALKSELLAALRATHPDGTLDGSPIPDSADDVLFAKPVDANNLAYGWVPLDDGAGDGAEDDEADVQDLFGEEAATASGSGKGKGKARVSGGSAGTAASSSSALDCPRGAGLRDGGVIAFRFRGGDAPGVALASTDLDEGLGLDDETMDGAGDGDAEVRRGERWDVVLPTYEDVYGLEDLVPDDQMGTPRANKHSDWS